MQSGLDRRSKAKSSGAWTTWKKSLSCKPDKGEVHTPKSVKDVAAQRAIVAAKTSRSGCSKSLANLKDVIHGNTRVMHKSASSSPHAKENSVCDEFPMLSESRYENMISRPVTPRVVDYGSFRATAPLRKFSACNGCNVVDEAAFVFHRESSVHRSMCKYPQPICQTCGESFHKYEALEHHHVVRHAVSEVSRGDSSRNIVEIIFRTSWLKKEIPCGNIERILKVRNSQKTICRFEEYREMVKAKASAMTKKHARCLADGNELLRFYGATLACSLGACGTSNLCNVPACNVCRIIRSGFSVKKEPGKGIYTTATSGKAHDSMILSDESNHGERAMLVCRVIAGRMQKGLEHLEEGSPPSGYDSIAGELGTYSNVDDLYIFNSRAVLPCFVVIYRC